VWFLVRSTLGKENKMKNKIDIALAWATLLAVIVVAAVALVGGLIALEYILQPINAPYHDALMGR
jgi:hypothetical protein